MAGIYIHIPFCKQQCTYCDFHFSTTFEVYRKEMIDAICLELKTRKKYLQGKEVNTIYFGGGTPSILLESELTLILDTIFSTFSVNLTAEISLEANPDDINSSSLNMWKQHGINRLSIGLQSFKQSDLDWMNRAHNVADSSSCVSLAQAHGFENITVDLMYGLPDLSMDEWSLHVNRVMEMGVPHLSAYCLTVEEKTTLSNWVRKGKINTSTEDTQSDQFVKLLECIEKYGYEQYEISNFSKPGFESKHNSNYWKGEWYLGVGPSAHSFNGASRSWAIANNRGYIKALKNNSTYIETEQLSAVDQFNERILIGLRTSYGVNLDDLSNLNEITEAFNVTVNGFKEKHWVKDSGGTLTLTKEGKLRADYIASALFLD
ncbi:MAG: radical SAM family heme chaperone HemW [Crocinitomicaceae bacterium]|nr:radical SAM family heme chaperone HemW [Crocinitomicaceae bacterium]MDG1776192.1 radical SAM family heme chaperone HemW [Crocinitomicaceae bacterium]